MKRKPDNRCPCGNSKTYAQCCGLFHAGGIAPTAEALMRSRYSAYVLGIESYLLATWHPSTRPAMLDLAAPPVPHWLGLEVKRHAPEGDTATVEFVARYRIGGQGQRLHEVSRFRFEQGRWFYLSGEFPDTPHPPGTSS